MRYGPKQLESDVARLNSELADLCCLKRFEVGARNNYQAVDEFSVNENGARIGSGVDCNVACGTSREVYAATETRYFQICLDNMKGKE
jgi:hypothetical protein